MKLKITGRIYATFNEVIEEFIIDLNKDNVNITQSGEIITVAINNKMKLFESNSMLCELID